MLVRGVLAGKHAGRRFLNIHEYQSQQLLKQHKVNVARGGVAESAAAARDVAAALPGSEYVIKAQILAGGRGLGTFDTGLKGGVHLTKSAAEVEKLAGQMLGRKLITKQTGEDGAVVNKVFVVEKVEVALERYFAIVMDRKFGGPVVIASAQGGTSIEDIAKENPSAIIKEPVDILAGLSREQAERIASGMQFSPASVPDAATQILHMYEMFAKTDATMLEINPFVELQDGKIIALDAKVNFDDNAHFRQKAIFGLRDRSQEDPREVQADEFDLNYIGLDGNIACLVNGAGLAMSTMDIISLYGGSPANFLDVGGSANEKQVEAAFKILSADPRVEAILINIFGGIMRCDVIARGILKAMETAKVAVPLVVRLQGTNVDAAREMISESGKKITVVSGLDQAAQTAVKLATEYRASR